MTGESQGVHTLAEDIARCVHCGFCLQACPTYLDLGMETDSPRGRIALIDAVSSGRAEPTPSLLGHLDLCLQCRACETACPSGVPYGRIMETARASIVESGARPFAWRIRIAALRQTLPFAWRLSALFALLRLYQHSPMAWIAGRVLPRMSPALAATLASLPRVRGVDRFDGEQPADLTKTVALLDGCVMPHLYGRTHAATVRVLNRLGYRVAVPRAQTCCGALNLHAGDRRFARELARRNIDAFLAEDVAAIVVDSAGCGSTMKEYGELLADDPVYAEPAARLSGLTKDVLEFVAEHELPPLRRSDTIVTYQDSCHLVHAQKVTLAPRALMRAIPGLELRELTTPDRCCGSAGLYSMVQGSMSRRLLEGKLDDVIATDATTIATANPGCMIQLEAGLRGRGSKARVVHVIELLDEAMHPAP